MNRRNFTKILGLASLTLTSPKILLGADSAKMTFGDWIEKYPNLQYCFEKEWYECEPYVSERMEDIPVVGGEWLGAVFEVLDWESPFGKDVLKNDLTPNYYQNHFVLLGNKERKLYMDERLASQVKLEGNTLYLITKYTAKQAGTTGIRKYTVLGV